MHREPTAARRSRPLPPKRIPHLHLRTLATPEDASRDGARRSLTIRTHAADVKRPRPASRAGKEAAAYWLRLLRSRDQSQDDEQQGPVPDVVRPPRGLFSSRVLTAAIRSPQRPRLSSVRSAPAPEPQPPPPRRFSAPRAAGSLARARGEHVLTEEGGRRRQQRGGRRRRGRRRGAGFGSSPRAVRESPPPPRPPGAAPQTGRRSRSRQVTGPGLGAPRRRLLAGRPRPDGASRGPGCGASGRQRCGTTRRRPGSAGGRASILGSPVPGQLEG